MLCDKCGKNEASVFMKQVINNQQSTQHLCEHCAAELMDIGNLSFGKFFADGIGTLFGSRPQSSDSCPVCGLTYAEYNHNGLLGCSECYTTFARQLEPTVRAMHGKTLHTGKGRLPKVAGATVRTAAPASTAPDDELITEHPEILVMQQRLSELIQAEKFEEAAVLRDQIKALSAGNSATTNQAQKQPKDAAADENNQ